MVTSYKEIKYNCQLDNIGYAHHQGDDSWPLGKPSTNLMGTLLSLENSNNTDQTGGFRIEPYSDYLITSVNRRLRFDRQRVSVCKGLARPPPYRIRGKVCVRSSSVYLVECQRVQRHDSFRRRGADRAEQGDEDEHRQVVSREPRHFSQSFRFSKGS